MNRFHLCSVALAVLVSVPAHAGDKVLIQPIPAWVTPAPASSAALSGGSAAQSAQLPRFDEQVKVEGDTVTAYVDVSKPVVSAENLARLGTLSIGWQPSRGDLTLHRIEIIRNGQVIDALKGGEGLTVLRREAGLERLEVNGQLTAVKHIEGLQVGDLLRMAFSISSRDETLGGYAQDALVLLPAPLQIGFGRARIVWPTALPLAWKPMMSGLTLTPRPVDSKWTELVVPLPAPKLPEMPKNMPSRFTPLPLITFTTFPDWAAVVKVMAPLYNVKGAIAPGSELAAKVDAIAASSTDPERRMSDALQLVQQEVRYQLIALGSGNYVPQTPAETWAKRYGDCKAKTLLLLAILDRLGIEAEPVLANSASGDAVAQMLPAVQAFNHVFVRAKVGGESYWLDGTMLGSRLADIHDVPRFGFVLPLFAKEAVLVDLPRRAHARPDIDVDLAYDMTSGPHLPAPFHLTVRYAGQYGEIKRVDQGADYQEKLTTFAEGAAKLWTSSVTIAKPQASYDPASAVWTLVVDGVAYPDWEYRDGHFGLAVAPPLQVNMDAPRDRASWRAIPALIAEPWTAHLHVVTTLPEGGKGVVVTGNEPGSVSLPAVEWNRAASFAGAKFVDDITSRESGAEIPADTISKVHKTLSDEMAKTVHIELSPAYPQRWEDVVRMRASPALAKVRAMFDQRVADKPDDATRLADRAWFAGRLFDYATAEADYTKAIEVDGSASRYLDRAELRAKRGDHAGALKDAQAAYDLEQGNEDARSWLANELAEAGKVDDGLDLLTPDPDVTTTDGLSSFGARITLLEMGNRHDDAMAQLDHALEKRGSSAELRNMRCWYEGLRGSNLDSALVDCDKAIELSSNPTTYLDSRAMVHFRAGRLDQALIDYEKALESSQEMASSLFMAGIVNARLGNKEKGARQISAARIVFPDIDHFYQRFGIKP